MFFYTKLLPLMKFGVLFPFIWLIRATANRSLVKSVRWGSTFCWRILPKTNRRNSTSSQSVDKCITGAQTLIWIKIYLSSLNRNRFTASWISSMLHNCCFVQQILMKWYIGGKSGKSYWFCSWIFIWTCVSSFWMFC